MKMEEEGLSALEERKPKYKYKYNRPELVFLRLAVTFGYHPPSDKG